MKKIAFGATLAVAALLGSTGAMAQSYVSIGAGPSHYNVDCSGVASCSNNATAFKLTGGHTFANGLAVELGYIDFGKIDAADSGVAASARATALTLGLAYNAAIATDWGLGLRLGVASMKAKISATSGGLSGSDSKTKAKAYFGFGVNYALDKNWKIEGAADFSRAEYDSTLSANVRAITIGARYTF